jgi:hypothetical protein
LAVVEHERGGAGVDVASNCVRKPVVTAVWKFHCDESCPTFAGVICLSGLWRCPE